MTSTPSGPTRRSAATSWPHAILTTVLPSAVIPVAVAVLVRQYWGAAQWPHQPFHSLIEATGSFAAILLALFIIIMRRGDQLRPGYVWVATTLMGMGLLDGFHAGVQPGPAFVWLHSMATLMGGATFALVVLPERISALPRLHAAPYLMAAGCVLLGIGSVLFPGLIPAMAENGHFTALAELMNAVGGAGFVLAWFHFARQKNPEDRGERLVLANHCLLFGMAGLLFHFSTLWDATWWLWHLLRLIAYLVILWFFLSLYNADIKRIQANRNELESTRKRLSDIIENSPSIITLKDTAGRFVLANRQFKERFGIAPEAAVGKTAAELFPAEVAEPDRAGDRRVIEHGLAIEGEETLALGAGPKTFLTARFPLGDRDQGIYGVGCIQTDISERKAMEESLRLAQRIIENTAEAVVVTDADGLIVDINQAYTRITGYERHELIGMNPNVNQSGRHEPVFFVDLWRQLIDTGYWAGEIWDRRKDGEVYPKWLTINAIRDDQGKTRHYVGIFTDISEKKATETKLKNLAFYDPLTGLPNRVYFRERLEEALAVRQRRGSRMALLFIDLDRFKDVNDTLGHNAGDELIVQASKRIRGCLRKTDTVARLGGDEFTVILAEVANEAYAGQLAQHVIERLRQRFVLSGTDVFIGASIGISLYPEDGDDSETLVRNADTAMYHAKENGRGNYQFFRAEMNQRMQRRVTLERNLRHALENDEFVLHYQPKYILETGRLSGVEALVRWRHPLEGLVPPAEFIPLAEETNLILPLGKWVLQTACRQVKDWEMRGLGLHRVSVNLSSRQFQQPDLVRIIRDSLDDATLNPDFLELEITESVVMNNPEAAARLLDEIRAMGVHVAIDDFGTGYSSLAYLKKFPIDALKIDKSFVRDLPQDGDDAAIVESIIALARSLGLGVVAEGVETQAQCEFLRAKGCREVQGFYFSKPLAAEVFVEQIKVLSQR